jgi:hypothetical protein
MVNIWELFLKQNKKAKYLPVIIPLVIYHGRYKWKISKKFISLFKNTTDLEKYIPDFSYNLYDISHIPDEEIKGTVKLRILFTALKYIFTPELKYKVPGIFKLLRELKDKAKGTQYLEVLLRYIGSSARYLTKEELMETVSNILKEGGELMQTIAEQWIEQGVEQGIEQGKIIDRQDVLMTILRNRFGLKKTDSQLIKRTKNLEKLGRAFNTALSAKAKEEVLEILKS